MAAHLPPPPALALMLVGQHWARAGLAANGDIALGVQRIGGHPLQQDASLDVSRLEMEHCCLISDLKWSSSCVRRHAATSDQLQWPPDMSGCGEQCGQPEQACIARGLRRHVSRHCVLQCVQVVPERACGSMLHPNHVQSDSQTCLITVHPPGTGSHPGMHTETEGPHHDAQEVPDLC